MDQLNLPPTSPETGTLDLIPLIEGLLFLAENPLAADVIQKSFGDYPVTAEEIELALNQLSQKYGAQSGIVLRKVAGGYQLVTNALIQPYLQRTLPEKPLRLSRSGLETLAIIAYREPVTRAEIDALRGVESAHLLRALLERNLIRMSGKADIPGRPVQYVTTSLFLETLGLQSLKDLPPLSEWQEMRGMDPTTQNPLTRFENGLDAFLDDAREKSGDPSELTGAVDQALSDASEVIDSVAQIHDEIYDSPLHEMIGQENQRAVISLQRWKQIQKLQLRSAPPSA